MYLDNRTIERKHLDPDTNDLGTLQFDRYAIQYPAFRPAVQPRINRMPLPKPLWQTTPLAAMLGNMENRIQQLEIRHADVAALAVIRGICPIVYRKWH